MSGELETLQSLIIITQIPGKFAQKTLEIFLSASSGKPLGKEIIEISSGIILPVKEISIMGKKIIFSASPRKVMGKETIEIS